MNLNWIKIISLNIGVIIVLLAILDPLIPILTSQKNGAMPRSLRLQEHNLNRTSIIKQEQRKISFRTNKNGFIIGDDYNDKFENSILFLGSSTTECFLVDEDKRFPFHSVKLINEKLNTNFTSLNGAIGANNLFHIYLNLISKTFYPNKKPNYVFITVGVSDFGYLDAVGNYLEGPRSIILENNELTFFKFLKTTKDFIFPNLYLASKKLFEFKIPSNIQGGVDNYTGYKKSFLKENQDLLINQWENLLDMIISFCKIHTMNLIFLTEHNIDSLKENNNYSILRKENRIKLNSILRIKSKLNQIPLIDLDSLMEKDETLYFNDKAHLNNKGSLKASKIISDTFIKFFLNEEI